MKILLSIYLILLLTSCNNINNVNYGKDVVVLYYSKICGEMFKSRWDGERLWTIAEEGKNTNSKPYEVVSIKHAKIGSDSLFDESGEVLCKPLEKDGPDILLICEEHFIRGLMCSDYLWFNYGKNGNVNGVFKE
ncbi:MAG: hypothetical protein GXY61_15020 [Lentisphaerae bacterium]|jgi:hypothetical protein|nr:hypothetical protein [Lentisphaerota bacterium]